MGPAGTKSSSDQELTPPYGRLLGRIIRPFPNFDLFFVQSLRRQAVERLHLRPGDRVLDAGCGPGGSFPYLVDAVGKSGAVVGVEISPDLAMAAQRRVDSNGWANVQVVTADAKAVHLQGNFDAMLMLGAPDVYGSPEALDHLIPYLKPNARVVAFGARLNRGTLGKLLNPAIRSIVSKATFPSTPGLSFEPWKTLGDRTGALTVVPQFFGWMFLAWGVTASGHR